MARPKFFLVFTLAVSFLDATLGKASGDTSNAGIIANCDGNSQCLDTGVKTSNSVKLGAGQKISLNVQLPSIQVDPNLAGAVKLELPKLPDLFKGFGSVGSFNGGLNISNNPLGDIFKSSSSLNAGFNTNNLDKLGAGQNISLKVQLPSLKVDPTLGGTFKLELPKLPDLFKGVDSVGSLNGDLNISKNPLGDIFKSSNSLNAGFNTNSLDKFGAGQNISLKLQLPSLKVDPNLGAAFKLELPKLPDLFKGFGSVGSFNGGLNISKNPLGDIFKSSNSLNAGFSTNSLDKLGAGQNISLKVQLPSLKVDPNLGAAFKMELPKLPDLFKGVDSVGSLNGGLNISNNPLGDIFKSSNSLKAGLNTNNSDKIGAGQNISLKLQLPSLKVDPNLGAAFKLELPKLPDLFKGVDSVGSFNGGLNISNNPLGDIFKSSNSLNAGLNTNNLDKIGAGQNISLKLQLPSLKVDPNLGAAFKMELPKLPDLFKGVDSVRSFNGGLNISKNPLGDIFKSFNSLNAGFNTNSLDKLGAGHNISLKLQLPSLKVDPNLGAAFKLELPKLPDLFKGVDSMGSFNGGLNISKNPLGDIFTSSNSEAVHEKLNLPNGKFKFELPPFQIDPNFTAASIFNPTRNPDFFKGFRSSRSINDSLNLNSNILPDHKGALKPLTDIFDGLIGINRNEEFNINGVNNVTGQTIIPNFMKLLTCLIEFTKSLNVDLEPVKDFVKGLKGLTKPPNFIENLTNGLGKFEIDSQLLNNIAKWVNNLNVGLQMDPIKVEEILGGVEGLAKINGFLAPYIETIVAGLGALDVEALIPVIEGILALVLLL